MAAAHRWQGDGGGGAGIGLWAPLRRKCPQSPNVWGPHMKVSRQAQLPWGQKGGREGQPETWVLF